MWTTPTHDSGHVDSDRSVHNLPTLSALVFAGTAEVRKEVLVVRVVRARPDQLDTVLSLVDRLLAELADDPTSLQRLDRDHIGSQLLHAGDRFAAFLAFDATETPVGVATLTEGVAAYAGGRYGIISEFYVAPRSRGLGIGRQLLETIRAEARRRGWHRVDVAAPPGERWDRTVDFYCQNGFILTGRKLKLRID
jgi:GNAT superfamily N-acetyltransferase